MELEGVGGKMNLGMGLEVRLSWVWKWGWAGDVYEIKKG